MGRRIVAWIIDWVPAFAIPIILGASAAERTDFGSSAEAEAFCDVVNDGTSTSEVCATFNEWVVLIDGSDLLAAVIAGFAYSLFFLALLPAVAGWSIGKLIMGLRVVDQTTFQPAGFGAHLVRWLLWIVDGAPYCVPLYGLVGFITGLASKGNRRVGDMAASTLVVRKDAVGHPVTIDGLSTAAVPPPSTWPGQPPPPTAPPTAPPAVASPPLSADVSAPPPAVPPAFPAAPPSEPRTFPPPDADAALADLPPPEGPPAESPPTAPPVAEDGFVVPGADTDDTTAPQPRWVASEQPPLDTPPEPSPVPEPEPFAEAAPIPEPAPAPEPEPETAQASAAAPRPGVDEPQWDAARDTYIQWDPELEAWMEWDDRNRRWVPIST